MLANWGTFHPNRQKALVIKTYSLHKRQKNCNRYCHDHLNQREMSILSTKYQIRKKKKTRVILENLKKVHENIKGILYHQPLSTLNNLKSYSTICCSPRGALFFEADKIPLQPDLGNTSVGSVKKILSR